MIGSVLTVIVLLTFLRNVSSTLLISTAIPASILATILLMLWGGLTLNLMTFGGLALAIGMLVDNAIVVLENIFRHREEGRPPKLAAEEASNEVGTAISASTLTTVVVFLPMFFTTGIASVMFRPLAFVVTVSLMCSLLVALTLIPSLAAHALVMRKGAGLAARLGDAGERGLVALEGGYRRMLVWFLRRLIPAYYVLMDRAVQWMRGRRTVPVGVPVAEIDFGAPLLKDRPLPLPSASEGIADPGEGK